MDSLSYGLVAEKLGISLRNVAQNTAAVIIDGQVFVTIANSTYHSIAWLYEYFYVSGRIFVRAERYIINNEFD